MGRKREVREVVALKDPGTVPIHTVAFEEPRAKENLREISKMTSGQFTYVPEPDVFASSEVRERMAAHWMAVANKLEKESRPDMAQRYYEKILDHFTGSEVASEAERRRQEYLVMSPKDR